MITDLVFDFFGTLAGYTPGAFHEPYTATHELLRAEGLDIEYAAFQDGYSRAVDRLEEHARATYVEYHHDQVADAFFSECFTLLVPTDVRHRVAASFVAEWNRGTVFRPEITELLHRLSHRFRLSVLSNTHYPPMIHANLRTMGVDRLIAHVTTSVEFGYRKPDPRIFYATLAALEILPEQAVYIGDTFEDDYQGATAAGLRCILIDPDGQWAGVVPERVERIEEIERLLG